MLVSLAKLKKDGLQTRTGLDEATVRRYVEDMTEQVQRGLKTIGLGKIVVYKDTDPEGTLWLADGFHRVEAAVRCGIKRLDAEVERGGYVNALRYSLKCNATHGKPTTNDDKKNALRIAWEHRRELFGLNDPTANWLANTCGVSQRMAEDFYAAISARCGDLTPQRQAENGRSYTMPQRPVRPVRAPLPTVPVRPSAPVVTASAPVAAAPAAPVRPAHVVPTDRFGVEIPVPLQPAFNGDNADKLAQLVRLISEARCLCKRETESGNLAFAAVRQELLMQLNTAYNFASAAAPHCVCRMCQGNGCTACHGRGWQTEDEHGRNPDDFKGVEVRT